MYENVLETGILKILGELLVERKKKTRRALALKESLTGLFLNSFFNIPVSRSFSFVRLAYSGFFSAGSVFVALSVFSVLSPISFFMTTLNGESSELSADLVDEPEAESVEEFSPASIAKKKISPQKMPAIIKNEGVAQSYSNQFLLDQPLPRLTRNEINSKKQITAKLPAPYFNIFLFISKKNSFNKISNFL